RHRGQAHLPERGPLLRRRVQVHGDPDRPVHTDLRAQPRRRVGRPRHGAARQQPTDPAARAVHRADARHVRPDRPPLGRRGTAPAVGARVTIAMSVFNQLALTRACLESLRATTEPFRLVVIDNGSTDDTARVFERFEYPYPLRFERNGENRPVIATLNRAWRLAETDYVCVLHNDTELVEPEWLARLVAALAEPGAGLAGLYGVKRLRRSGRYAR